MGQRTLFGLAKTVKRDRTTCPQAIDPQEAFRLGTSLGQQGDLEGARSAYQQASDSRDPEHAPAAGFYLGILLGQHYDTDGGKAHMLLNVEEGLTPRVRG